jgi:tripartite-type tricarboxylate transporter receptor subunit TctC
MTSHRLMIAVLAAALVFPAAAHAQSDYPNNTVRIVVDSAAGSANDSTSRVIGDALSKKWGQGVVTMNQPGAGGGISAKVASQSPPDGYTLYMPSTSAFLAIPGGPGVAPNLPVELPRDFTPISYVVEQPLYIGASHKSEINTIADVIRLAKEKPGQVTYAATGRGRLTHLTMELLQVRTDIKLQLVPYAGGPAQAMNDVMSGLVPMVLDGYAGLAPAIKGNLIKGLAATSLKRLPGFEQLPTVAETVPDFFVGAWTVLLAPVGTPPAIIQKIHNDMRGVLDDPEMQAKLALNGGFVRHMEPAEITAFVQNEQKTWRPIMQKIADEAKK